MSYLGTLEVGEYAGEVYFSLRWDSREALAEWEEDLTRGDDSDG